MPTFEHTLHAELNAAPVVDPHTHLRASKPAADNLADLVLYHHVWVELVSAGMPPTAATRAGLPHELADPGMDPLDRVNAALPYLPHVRNTTCGYLLRTLLADLYGVPAGELTKDNVDDVAARVAERAGDPSWASHVLKDRCHIQSSLTVERGQGPPWDASMGRGIEQSLNLVSGKKPPRETLADMERSLGAELRTAEDLGRALHDLGKRYSNEAIRFVGLWLLPHLEFTDPGAAEVTRILRRADDGESLDRAGLSAFTSYSLRRFLSGLRSGPLRTIQVIVGAQVLPPHRSLTHWSPEFPGALGRIAGEFEEFRFDCSTASDLYTQDLAILAKHVPNISVGGYWWHTLYPYYIRKSIEARLDIVPANKTVAFFSDAYHAEWCYPKLKLVKRIFGDVLRERVECGLLTEQIALSLARETFFDNPIRIYGLPVA
jgi:hypothetical protein